MEHQEPVFSELIALPETQRALHALGFGRPRYWSGFVIAKEPHSGPLYWHQDWPFWDDPASAEPLPHQLFLMWYLVDTRPENGCSSSSVSTFWAIAVRQRGMPVYRFHRLPCHGLGVADGLRRGRQPGRWRSIRT